MILLKQTLTAEELAAVYELLRQAKESLDSKMKPTGYNLGVNVGQAAGQTVMHVHVHLIPRYSGDVSDPTGGVRNLIPGKGPYDLPREGRRAEDEQSNTDSCSSIPG